jgi:hypothetical protein
MQAVINSQAMLVFDFDISAARDHYAEHGWVHIPGGVSADFLAELTRFVHESLEANYIAGRASAGPRSRRSTRSRRPSTSRGTCSTSSPRSPASTATA